MVWEAVCFRSRGAFVVFLMFYFNFLINLLNVVELRRSCPFLNWTEGRCRLGLHEDTAEQIIRGGSAKRKHLKRG